MGDYIKDNCYWHKHDLQSHYDFIIIGGGFVGMYTALQLREKRGDATILIIESEPEGALASSRNAGFACFGSLTEILHDIAVYGEEKVSELVEMRWHGLQMILKKYGGAVNYNQIGGYEVFQMSDDYNAAAEHLDSVNQSLRFLFKRPVFESIKTPAALQCYENAFLNRFEGHLNTGRYFRLLRQELIKNEIQLICGEKVTCYEENPQGVRIEIEASKNSLMASQIVVCTNSLQPSWLDTDSPIVPVRNQIIVTQPLNEMPIRGTFHMDQGYVYFRDVDNRILIGGARNLFPEEATHELGANRANRDHLLDLLKSMIPLAAKEFRIEFEWSGILSGGTSRLPIVDRQSDKVTFAIRLGGMGVAIAPIIGQRAAALVLE